MGRVAATLIGALVLALFAGGLTEVTLAIGHRGLIADDIKSRPASSVVASPTLKPSVTPSATPTPSASTTPSVSATPTPGTTATTNAFVHLRADKTTSSTILANLNGGTELELLPYSDSQWQQVDYNGTQGYVYKSYLTYQ